jgi:hypothetical protein
LISCNQPSPTAARLHRITRYDDLAALRSKVSPSSTRTVEIAAGALPVVAAGIGWAAIGCPVSSNAIVPIAAPTHSNTVMNATHAAIEAREWADQAPQHCAASVAL